MESLAKNLEKRQLKIFGKDELENQFPNRYERNKFLNILVNEFEENADTLTIMGLNEELTIVKIEDYDNIYSRIYKRDFKYITLNGDDATNDAIKMLSIIKNEFEESKVEKQFNDNYGKYIKSLPDFVISGKMLKMIQDYIYSNVNILLSGGPGTGKTDFPQKFAKALNMECLVIDCGTIKTPQDWFGTREYVEGKGTIFVESTLLEYLQQPSIIILDELNRTTPDCHNSIFRILDGNREVHIMALRKTIKVHPHCIIMATMNEGRSHTGTYMMDSAITDRFEIFNLEIPTEKQIVKLLSNNYPTINNQYLEALAKITHKLNDLYYSEDINVQIGLRPAQNACKLIVRNNKFVDILNQTFTGRFSNEGGNDSERITVRQTISGLVTKELLNSKNCDLQDYDNIYGNEDEFKNSEFE